MNIPSFSDFLQTMTPETLAEITTSAEQFRSKAKNIGPGAEIGVIAWSMTLDILSKYHLWLQDALKDS